MKTIPHKRNNLMSALYNNTLSSKAQNSQNVNKQSNSRIRGCKTFFDNTIYNLNSQVNNNIFGKLFNKRGEMFFEKLLLKIKKPRYYKSRTTNKNNEV